MIKKQLPNLFTCLNLLCGCLAVISAFEGSLTWSAYLVGVALIMDFLDGFVARLLKVGSEMGKQLDSLADMVTFGLVPGIIMFKMLNIALFISTINEIGQVANFNLINPMAYLALLIPVFSALRLAKFNIDTRQSDSFIGVPTPATAMLIASLPLIINLKSTNILGLATKFTATSLPDITAMASSGNSLQSLIRSFLLGNEVPDGLSQLVLSPILLIILILLFSFLMVAELPLIALKFKNFGWAANKMRYILLTTSLLLLIIFQYTAIPIIILLYIILSAINNRLTAANNNT